MPAITVQLRQNLIETLHEFWLVKVGRSIEPGVTKVARLTGEPRSFD